MLSEIKIREPEFTEEEVRWITDFIINKLMPAHVLLQRLLICDGIDKKKVKDALDSLNKIIEWIRKKESEVFK